MGKDNINDLRLLHHSLEHLPNPYICLLQVGWEKCKPSYSYTNYRDMYLIHIVKSGKGTLQINNQTYQLGVNDMFLIRPNQLAIYSSDSEEPWEYYYFAFNGAFSSELIERTVFKKNKSVSSNADISLTDLIVEASRALQNSENPDLVGVEWLFKFLPLICNISKKTSQERQLYLKYILPIQQYIEQHLSEPIQASDISHKFNIDRTYFFRLFKKYVGESPEKYIISLRIHRAKLLITATNLPITTISSLVGYENYPPFFSAFKKIVGVSPAKYRKNAKNPSHKSDNGLLELKE